MDQILSADEVGALLSAMQEGEIELEEPEIPLEHDPEVIIKGFDLTNKDGGYRGNLPGFEIVNDRIAKNLSNTLTRLLRINCEVQLMSTESIRYEDFIIQSARPVCLHLFQLKPLPGLAAITMDASLVFGLVDTLCGSDDVKSLTGRAVKLLNRDFTSIEVRVISRLAESMENDITASFEGIAEVDATYVKSETRPELAGISMDVETVLHSVFEVIIGKHKRLMGLVVPHSLLEPIRPMLLKLARTDNIESPEVGDMLEKHMQDTHANMTVEFGRTRVDLRTLLELTVGDVIRLDKSIQSPLSIMVEGVPKFRGVPLTVCGQLGIKIGS